MLDSSAGSPTRHAQRVRSARAFVVHQIVHKILFERRAVEYRIASAERPKHAPGDAPISPDPWSIHFNAPADGSDWSDTSLRASDARHLSCTHCDAHGRQECNHCYGSGSIRQRSIDGREHQQCPRCGGSGKVDCDVCSGTRFVTSTPVIRAETGTSTRMRNLASADAPTELLVRLSGIEIVGGASLMHEAGVSIASRVSQGAYRSGGESLTPEVDAAIDEMLQADAVDGDWRLRGHVLDVVRANVYEVTLRGGRIVYLVGDPVRLLADDSGSDPAPSVSSNPWTVAAIGAAAITAALLAVWWITH